MWQCLKDISQYSMESSAAQCRYMNAVMLASKLPPTNSVRLAVSYHYAKFTRDVLNERMESCEILEEAIIAAEACNPATQTSSSSVLKKLRKILSNWKAGAATTKSVSFVNVPGHINSRSHYHAFP